MPAVLRYEQEAWADGRLNVAGLDEAGRGPWAGPVVAACACFDAAYLRREEGGALRGLKDSKQLTAARREHFFDLLMCAPGLAHGVGVVEVDEIDRLNILRATHLAMARAVTALARSPDLLLVDGRPVPGLPCPSRAIVKGDAKSLSIAAASVIAKVTRDRLMCALDRAFPGYGFARHKGYGTAAHREALRCLGPCVQHRRSFRPVAALLSSPPPPARCSPLPGF